MAWQLHYATVNGKTVVTSEPHEVPDDAPVGHVTPLDGHSAVTVPDGILNANRGKDYLGREVRTRILRGVRRLTSLLPGPATLTWAEANRHRIISAFEGQRRAVMEVAPFSISIVNSGKADGLVKRYAATIILFHACLLKLWDSADVTDEHREVLLELSESWDGADADAYKWMEMYRTWVEGTESVSARNVPVGVIHSAVGADLKAAYPAMFTTPDSVTAPNQVTLTAPRPWRLV